MPRSRNEHFSSNPSDSDPALITTKLIKNKICHEEFDSSLLAKESVKQIEAIIKRNIKQIRK